MSGAAMSLTSVPTAAPVRPASCVAAFSSGSPRRPVMTTRCVGASRAAIAKPMPVAPPPISAVRAVMMASQGSCPMRHWA